MRLLILGGTTEASALARQLAGRADIEATLSLAGRTQSPTPPPIPVRTGGFGGVEGLVAYLRTAEIDLVIDATHPFAAQMSRHAASACAALGLPLAAFTRPDWQQRDDDRWTRVANMDSAVAALGERPRRVFLTVGGLQLTAFAAAPQHFYLVRTIEPPEALSTLPSHRLILARGPFAVDAEIALMRAEAIDTLVTKNSGGGATEAKITAARALALPVVMVDRPLLPERPAFHDLADVMTWIEGHRRAS
jgi:precorrin-6A/cobalt-precorrin-6A reductase